MTPTKSKTKVKKNIIRWLPKLLGLFLLGYIFNRVGVKKPIEMLSIAGPFTIITILLLNFPHIIAKALRWKIFLNKNGGKFPVFASIHAYFAGIAIGVITPGRAGEFFRALYPAKAGVVSTPVAISTVLVDRLYDLGFLLIISVIAGFFVSGKLVPLLAIGGGVGLLLILWITRRKWSKFIGFLAKKWKIKETQLDLFKKGFQNSLSKPLIPFFLTLTGYLIVNCQLYWLAIKMGIDISFIELMLYFSLANTIALLPVSFSGVGTREAALGLIFVLTGRSEIEGVTLAFGFFVLVALPVILTGTLALLLPPKWFLKPNNSTTDK
jgi:glycosyltransferase 2 family protein